jgi:hypothetical protein
MVASATLALTEPEMTDIRLRPSLAMVASA